MKLLGVLVLCFAFVAGPISVSMAAEIKSSICKRSFKQYEKKKGKKAFALSGNGQDCGYWFKAKTVDEAKQKALKECRRYALGGSCRLYKVQ